MPIIDKLVNPDTKCRECVMSDISVHFKKVEHWIPEEDKTSFQERMYDCVETESAWCTDNTFLYYIKNDKRLAVGVALLGKENAMELLSLFIQVFYVHDKETCMLRFQLHPGKFMEEYRSLLTTISMQRHHQNNKHPLMIRVDELRAKLVKLAERSNVSSN
jgi:hypothetical protein